MGTLGFKFHCDLKIVKDLKLVEIVTIIVVHNVEDKKTFSTISFMKSKLHNCLTTHLDLVVQMYIQAFYKLETIFEFPLTFPKKNLEMPRKKPMIAQIQYKILLNRIKKLMRFLYLCPLWFAWEIVFSTYPHEKNLIISCSWVSLNINKVIVKTNCLLKKKKV